MTGITDRATIATERAVDKCERGMSEDWGERAVEAIRIIATRLPEFTTDDVWSEIEPPREPSAMGIAMRRAAKDGICICTDGYRQSIRPNTHRRPLRVWRSLVHTTEPADTLQTDPRQEPLFA
jgi:hypothetical protein